MRCRSFGKELYFLWRGIVDPENMLIKSKQSAENQTSPLKSCASIISKELFPKARKIRMARQPMLWLPPLPGTQGPPFFVFYLATTSIGALPSSTPGCS